MLRKSLALVFILLFLDQFFKIWIKTHFYYGEHINVLGLSWFQLYFVENEGMAFGWKLAGGYGKLLLSLFRIVAITGIVYYMVTLIRKKQHKGLILTVAIVLAGAAGNLIDSAFYGLIFSASPRDYSTVAELFPPGGGYEKFLHGKVVDMLYFELINGNWPSWVPWVGGDRLIFFRPIFNLADSYISIGVALLIIFQHRFFKKHDAPSASGSGAGDEQTAVVSDDPEAATEVRTQE